MSPRSLNKIMLIGNLTRDPELRFTPQGTAVCTFGLATNRTWMPEGATERREETEFHRIVAWNKLAELCAQLLTKGRKVYVEGRITIKTWTGQDGTPRTTVEIVIEDMILLDSQRQSEAVAPAETVLPPEPTVSPNVSSAGPAMIPVADLNVSKKKKQEKQEKSPEPSAKINPDDIPF